MKRNQPETQRVFRNGRWEDVQITKSPPSVTPRKSATIADRKINKALEDGGAIANAIKEVNQCACDLTGLTTDVENLTTTVAGLDTSLTNQINNILYLQADVASLQNPLAFMATLVNSPATLLAVGDTIPLDTVVLDTTNGAITNVDGVITITKSGLYQISASEINSWISGYIVNLMVNGAIYAVNTPSVLLQVTAPTTISMQSGSAFTLATTAPQALLSILQVG